MYVYVHVHMSVHAKNDVNGFNDCTLHDTLTILGDRWTATRSVEEKHNSASIYVHKTKVHQVTHTHLHTYLHIHVHAHLYTHLHLHINV